jgi:hypothetical protein
MALCEPWSPAIRLLAEVHTLPRRWCERLVFLYGALAGVIGYILGTKLIGAMLRSQQSVKG